MTVRGAEACYSWDLNPDTHSTAISTTLGLASFQRKAQGRRLLGDGKPFGSHLTTSPPEHLGWSGPWGTAVMGDPWKRLSISPLLPGGSLERPGAAQGSGTEAPSITHSLLGQPPTPQEPRKKTVSKEKAFKPIGMLSKCARDNFLPKMLQLGPVARDRAHGHRAGHWGQGDYFWVCMALTRFWGALGDVSCR